MASQGEKGTGHGNRFLWPAAEDLYRKKGNGRDRTLWWERMGEGGVGARAPQQLCADGHGGRVRLCSP